MDLVDVRDSDGGDPNSISVEVVNRLRLVLDTDFIDEQRGFYRWSSPRRY